MASLEKVFNCLTCGAQIRLERKADNSGWLKYNLDGSDHVDEKKNKNSQTQQQIAELTKQVSGLNETVKVLISQIQSLRSEVKSKREVSNS
jgi:uncharacterized coiled-coil DUF342 family protein